jgi:predicted metal-binding membrane protein
VLLEKVLPQGELFSRVSALLLAGTGVLVIVAG